MSIAWDKMKANLSNHQDAWEQAKAQLGVTDVLRLSTEQFRDVIALAEAIRKQEVNL